MLPRAMPDSSALSLSHRAGSRSPPALFAHGNLHIHTWYPFLPSGVTRVGIVGRNARLVVVRVGLNSISSPLHFKLGQR